MSNNQNVENAYTWQKRRSQLSSQHLRPSGWRKCLIWSLRSWTSTRRPPKKSEGTLNHITPTTKPICCSPSSDYAWFNSFIVCIRFGLRWICMGSENDLRVYWSEFMIWTLLHLELKLNISLLFKMKGSAPFVPNKKLILHFDIDSVTRIPSQNKDFFVWVCFRIGLRVMLCLGVGKTIKKQQRIAWESDRLEDSKQLIKHRCTIAWTCQL